MSTNNNDYSTLLYEVKRYVVMDVHFQVIDIYDVQSRLSHANIEIILGTYAHAPEKTVEKSVDRFEKTVNYDLPTK